jgi:ERCC4-type nuclease
MATVHIDTRETALIAEIQHQKDDAVFTVEQLEIGDIHITTENGLLLVFERKTGADLASSIKDGRYREQKARLLSIAPAHHITYIIEDIRKCPLPKNVVSGITINTMYRDGIHIVYTANIRETAEFILKVSEKVSADPAKYICTESSGSVAPEYVDVVKIKSHKIENIDKQTCYMMQLGQIPGISATIARSIAQTYPSMRTLLCTLHDSDAPDKLLCGIPMIGEKKAKKIIEYLLE